MGHYAVGGKASADPCPAGFYTSSTRVGNSAVAVLLRRVLSRWDFVSGFFTHHTHLLLKKNEPPCKNNQPARNRLRPLSTPPPLPFRLAALALLVTSAPWVAMPQRRALLAATLLFVQRLAKHVKQVTIARPTQHLNMPC